MDRNCIYYYEFRYSSAWHFRLNFVPGDIYFLSVPAGESEFTKVAFPEGVFTGDFIINSGFDGNFPLGLKLGDSSKLVIDLYSLYGDWQEVSEWIQSGRSSEKTSYNNGLTPGGIGLAMGQDRKSVV